MRGKLQGTAFVNDSPRVNVCDGHIHDVNGKTGMKGILQSCEEQIIREREQNYGEISPSQFISIFIDNKHCCGAFSSVLLCLPS